MLQTFIISIFLFSSFLVQKLEAKEVCVRVPANVVLVGSSKKKKFKTRGLVYFKPIKTSSNKKFQKVSSGEYSFWVKSSDVKIGKKTSCISNMAQVGGFSNQRAIASEDENAEESSVVSSQKISTKSSKNKFFWGVGLGGVAAVGNTSALDSLITVIANPSDVSEDQNPIFTQTDYAYSGEVFAHLGFYLDLFSQDFIFNNTFSFRYNQYTLKSLKNPFSLFSVPQNSLSEGEDVDINRQLIVYKPELGLSLTGDGKSSGLDFFLGMSLWYELASKIEIPIKVCGTSGGCLKITNGLARADLDEIGIGYSATLKYRMGGLNFALTTDSIDYLLFRVGYQF